MTFLDEESFEDVPVVDWDQFLCRLDICSAQEPHEPPLWLVGPLVIVLAILALVCFLMDDIWRLCRAARRQPCDVVELFERINASGSLRVVPLTLGEPVGHNNGLSLPAGEPPLE